MERVDISKLERSELAVVDVEKREAADKTARGPELGRIEIDDEEGPGMIDTEQKSGGRHRGRHVAPLLAELVQFPIQVSDGAGQGANQVFGRNVGARVLDCGELGVEAFERRFVRLHIVREPLAEASLRLLPGEGDAILGNRDGIDSEGGEI